MAQLNGYMYTTERVQGSNIQFLRRGKWSLEILYKETAGPASLFARTGTCPTRSAPFSGLDRLKISAEEQSPKPPPIKKKRPCRFCRKRTGRAANAGRKNPFHSDALASTSVTLNSGELMSDDQQPPPTTESPLSPRTLRPTLSPWVDHVPQKKP